MYIHYKYKKYFNTAFILGPMTMFMALIGVMRNFGLHRGWMVKFVTTWCIMFPIAFVCGLFIIPIANKATNRIKFIEDPVQAEKPLK